MKHFWEILCTHCLLKEISWDLRYSFSKCCLEMWQCQQQETTRSTTVTTRQRPLLYNIPLVSEPATSANSPVFNYKVDNISKKKYYLSPRIGGKSHRAATLEKYCVRTACWKRYSFSKCCLEMWQWQ